MNAEQSEKKREVGNEKEISTSTSDYERLITEAFFDIFSSKSVSVANIKHSVGAYILTRSNKTKISDQEIHAVTMQAFRAEMSKNGVTNSYVKKYFAEKNLPYNKAKMNKALKVMDNSDLILEKYGMHLVVKDGHLRISKTSIPKVRGNNSKDLQSFEGDSSKDSNDDDIPGRIIRTATEKVFVPKVEGVLPESVGTQSGTTKVRRKNGNDCQSLEGHSTEDDERSGRIGQSAKAKVSKEEKKVLPESDGQKSNSPKVRGNNGKDRRLLKGNSTKYKELFERVSQSSTEKVSGPKEEVHQVLRKSGGKKSKTKKVRGKNVEDFQCSNRNSTEDNERSIITDQNNTAKVSCPKEKEDKVFVWNGPYTEEDERFIDEFVLNIEKHRSID